ncbi:MAG: helix-turn-helix transcriptional regulator, partial [Oscillospiraceae bacterium]|nr:helix-turn-helix transcriptional regulator [Oscillospiraceae bacterium]
RHLQTPITARDIADAAGYSPYHAARVFKAETGLSPFEYIRRERLTASARALRLGQMRVLDVALDFVFDSQEGFTRAFTNGFGISPRRYKAYPAPEGWRIPNRYLNRAQIKKAEDDNMNKTTTVFVQAMERPARKLILRRGRAAEDYFAYCEEIGCGESGNSSAWDVLTGIKEALYEPVGLWLPENLQKPGTGVYAHGVEVPLDYADALPEDFDVIELPACKMLVFQGEPYADENFMEAVGACMERIDTFNPEVYGYHYAPELAPRMQLSPMGWRGYIEMRPIR